MHQAGLEFPDGIRRLCDVVARNLGRGIPPVKALLILNDPAYGTERSYSGLRLAGALAESARRSTLDEMAEWTIWADKVITF